MKEKIAKTSGTVSTVAAVFIALGTFFAGYLVGSVVTIYQSKSSEPLTAESTPQIEMQKKIEIHKAATVRDPDNVEAWIHLGHLYFDSNQPENAIEAYEKALLLKPENPDVLTDLGIMYRRSKQFKKAVKAFETAAALDPAHEASRFNKGIVFLHDLDDKAGAIKAWEDLLKVNPKATSPSGQSLAQVVEQHKQSEQNKD